jgi:hypothetical protein
MRETPQPNAGKYRRPEPIENAGGNSQVTHAPSVGRASVYTAEALVSRAAFASAFAYHETILGGLGACPPH